LSSDPDTTLQSGNFIPPIEIYNFAIEILGAMLEEACLKTGEFF
jgi:hypothetical protein